MAKNKNKPPKPVEDEEIEAVGDGTEEGDSEPTDEDTEQAQEIPPEEEAPEVKNALAQHEANEAKREMTNDEVAHFHLDEIAKFCATKKEDHLLRDHGINRVHSGLILEMAEQKKKGRLKHFSDGHREMLRINYHALVKAQKIKA